MKSDYTQVEKRMQSLAEKWEERSDHRAVFLRCYLMMTRNMLEAIDQDKFNDSAWVTRLLHLFAHYYFVALEAYDREPADAPMVWQLAHNAASAPKSTTIQYTLLGINAHINYDLVLTLVALLGPEWAGLSAEQRLSRYHDHTLVNDIIGQTIDAVQDQLLEPTMPLMQIIDVLLGPLDEALVSHLIANWRETVWQNVVLLLDADQAEEKERLFQQVEMHALQLAKLIEF